MNQKLLAIAIAAAVAAPSIASADVKTTIYGDFRWSLNNVDTVTAQDGWSANNNASRVGIKGHVGNSKLKGIYHLQAAARNDSGGSGFGSRFFFAGLKGGFGSVVYGRTSTPYKLAGVKLDPFYDTSAGTGFGGANYGLSDFTNSFSDGTLAYTTPKFGGAFTANASIYIDDTNADDHEYNVGVQYKANGITAGIQHLELDTSGVIASSGGFNNGTQDSATRFYGKFAKKGAFSVAASYEITSSSVPGAAEPDFLYINGTFNIGKATKLAAAYSVVDDGTAGTGLSGQGDGFTVGVFHNVLPKTQVYALYSAIDFDSGADRDTLSLGVSHKFSLSNK